MKTNSIGYVTLSVSGAYSGDHFPFCFPLSLITDDVFWNSITGPENICVVDVATGLMVPKYSGSYFSKSGKAGLLYFDASSGSGKTYKICYGPKVRNADNVAAITNSGIVNFLPLSELSGTNLFDFCGNNGTLLSPASVNNAQVSNSTKSLLCWEVAGHLPQNSLEK